MENVEDACLDFTTVEQSMSEVEVVHLIPNGDSVDVTNENLLQYLEELVKYRLVSRISDQLKELLLGFHEVIPKSLLIIFDFMELELLLCGLPNIDVDDWMEHTNYSGLYGGGHEVHEVCAWFWELVREMSEERRAKLLQFVTGSSGVPGKQTLFSIHQCFEIFQSYMCQPKQCSQGIQYIARKRWRNKIVSDSWYYR